MTGSAIILHTVYYHSAYRGNSHWWLLCNFDGRCSYEATSLILACHFCTCSFYLPPIRFPFIFGEGGELRILQPSTSRAKDERRKRSRFNRTVPNRLPRVAQEQGANWSSDHAGELWQPFPLHLPRLSCTYLSLQRNIDFIPLPLPLVSRSNALCQTHHIIHPAWRPIQFVLSIPRAPIQKLGVKNPAEIFATVSCLTSLLVR